MLDVNKDASSLSFALLCRSPELTCRRSLFQGASHSTFQTGRQPPRVSIAPSTVASVAVSDQPLSHPRRKRWERSTSRVAGSRLRVPLGQWPASWDHVGSALQSPENKPCLWFRPPVPV